jgi:hypothetical protein
MVSKKDPEPGPESTKQIGSRGLTVLQWSVAAVWGLPLVLCCFVGWSSAFNYIKYEHAGNQSLPGSLPMSHHAWSPTVIRPT